MHGKQTMTALQNSRRVLHEVFELSHAKHESHLKPNEYFEIFVSELILRNRSLDRDMYSKGRLGGGGDGGIDSIHIFADDFWVDEKNVSDILSRESVRQIDLYLIQAKNSKKWEADVVHRFTASARDLLDTNRPLPKGNQTYSRKLLRSFRTFRDVIKAFATKSPTINVKFFYCSRGGELHPDLRHHSDELCDYAGKLGNGYKCYFTFLGASCLEALSRQPVPSEYCLALEGEPIKIWDQKSYIVLANLKKYAQFLSDDNGNLDSALFEANVRDWEGKNKVNLQIRKTLDHTPVEEFWWLNNGVTILASEADYDGKILKLRNPEIVNGLQTSRTIHEYFSDSPANKSENRRLLLRVIVLSMDREDDGRREVIRATNSHTAIRDAEIRSLDSIHFQIEKVLNGHEPPVHYERRKKYYRNLRPRVPANRIISVSRLTQSVLAALLCRPDDAMARPGDYLKPDNQEKYELVFNTEYDYRVYYYCAMLYMRVDKFMKSDERYTAPRRNTRLRLRYHVVTHLAMMYGDPKLDRFKKRASRLAKLDVSEIKDSHISDSVSIVIQLYQTIRKRRIRFPWQDFERELLEGIDNYHSRWSDAQKNCATREDAD